MYSLLESILAIFIVINQFIKVIVTAVAIQGIVYQLTGFSIWNSFCRWFIKINKI